MSNINRTPAQERALVLRVLNEPPIRPKSHSELLNRTGLSKWKLNRALDGLIGKGLVDHGYPEAGESMQELFWLILDPPQPYWLDQQDQDEDPDEPSDPCPEVQTE